MGADVSIGGYVLLFLYLPSLSLAESLPSVAGFLIEEPNGWVSTEGSMTQSVTFDRSYRYRLYGVGLPSIQKLSFSFKRLNLTHSDCQDSKLSAVFDVTNLDNYTGVTEAIVHQSSNVDDLVYLCAKVSTEDGLKWLYFSDDLKVYIYKDPIPMWVKCIIVAVLFILSGLFSGLNLGLMTLDINDLKIIVKAGDPEEKGYAKKIIPIRKRGNFLLCTLLLGNFLVNSIQSILLDSMLGSGMLAVIFSTLGIVMFGEIIPQAVCSRHGLAVGAHTLPITIFFMVLTSPMSYPISLVLDRVLGEEFGQVYDRSKLKEFIVAQNLEKTEANIILGALSLQNKTVSEVMRTLSEVYMLPAETLIDSFVIDQIRETGYSRIPIYDKERSNILNVLNFKDLTIINRDAPMRADLICEYFNRQIQIVYDVDTLDRALKIFLSTKTHLAIVKHHVGEEEGNDKDPYEVTVGLVTLEDILEEIIQEEIEDETDLPDRPVTRQRDSRKRSAWKNLAFSGSSGLQIPAQLRVAALQNLAMTHPELFGRNVILEPVLEKMFEERILVKHMFIYGDDENNTLYQRGEPTDFGIFLLEGRVVLAIGVDNLEFEATVFQFLGHGALKVVADQEAAHPITILEACELKKLPAFVPDYSARAKNHLQYVKITQKQYAALLVISDALKSRFPEPEDHRKAEFEDAVHQLFDRHFPRAKPYVPHKRLSHPSNRLTDFGSLGRLRTDSRTSSGLPDGSRSARHSSHSLGFENTSQPTSPVSVSVLLDESDPPEDSSSRLINGEVTT